MDDAYDRVNAIVQDPSLMPKWVMSGEDLEDGSTMVDIYADARDAFVQAFRDADFEATETDYRFPEPGFLRLRVR